MQPSTLGSMSSTMGVRLSFWSLEPRKALHGGLNHAFDLLRVGMEVTQGTVQPAKVNHSSNHEANSRVPM